MSALHEEVYRLILIDSAHSTFLFLILILIGLLPELWWVPSVHLIHPLMYMVFHRSRFRSRSVLRYPLVYSMVPLLTDLSALFLSAGKLSCKAPMTRALEIMVPFQRPSACLDLLSLIPYIVALLCFLVSLVNSCQIVAAYVDTGESQEFRESLCFVVRCYEAVIFLAMYIYTQGSGWSDMVVTIALCVARVALVCTGALVSLFGTRTTSWFAFIGVDVGLLAWSWINVLDIGITGFTKDHTIEFCLLLIIDLACFFVQLEHLLLFEKTNYLDN